MTDKSPTYTVDKLSEFVVRADQSDLRGQVLPTLKRNVLDSIACALGALDGELIPAIRAHAEQFSSRPTATFIGGGVHQSIRRPSSTRCWCATPICSTPI